MAAWVAYDAVSGDVLADGTERQVRRFAGEEETIVICPAADWRWCTRGYVSRMSGNPPRRNPPDIVHLGSFPGKGSC